MAGAETQRHGRVYLGDETAPLNRGADRTRWGGEETEGPIAAGRLRMG